MERILVSIKFEVGQINRRIEVESIGQHSRNDKWWKLVSVVLKKGVMNSRYNGRRFYIRFNVLLSVNRM
mgnify:CR=1 FL=1